jgi:hypothetical protein
MCIIALSFQSEHLLCLFICLFYNNVVVCVLCREPVPLDPAVGVVLPVHNLILGQRAVEGCLRALLDTLSHQREERVCDELKDVPAANPGADKARVQAHALRASALEPLG